MTIETLSSTEDLLDEIESVVATEHSTPNECDQQTIYAVDDNILFYRDEEGTRGVIIVEGNYTYNLTFWAENGNPAGVISKQTDRQLNPQNMKVRPTNLEGYAAYLLQIINDY